MTVCCVSALAGQAVFTPPYPRGAWAGEGGYDRAGSTGAAGLQAHPAVCCLTAAWTLPQPPTQPSPAFHKPALHPTEEGASSLLRSSPGTRDPLGGEGWGLQGVHCQLTEPREGGVN